jgi:hypothetical protein
LADPTPAIREAAIEAVATADPEAAIDSLVPALLGALDDDSPRIRRTAAAVLASRATVADGIVDVLITGTPRAQEAALLALLGHGPAVRGQVVAWTEAQIARATLYRSERLALGYGPEADPPPRPATAAFLASVLAHRERQLTDRALGALAVLGAPEARGVIRRSLRSEDKETRAQALEALDSVGDRHLGSAIVRLLDADSGTRTQAREAVLSRLADDDDPWIGALARRTIADAGGTPAMPDTERTMSDIETMLTLRRVPLFGELEPEDLQRVARTSVERLYPPGGALIREGDIGDELMVIIEGTVRVVRAEPDGSERLIRRYEAGDHIGELALLREAPRAASVIAESSGVRTLVIGGESLRAILRERPDAAMAMLATLAERISAQ